MSIENVIASMRDYSLYQSGRDAGVYRSGEQLSIRHVKTIQDFLQKFNIFLEEWKSGAGQEKEGAPERSTEPEELGNLYIYKKVLKEFLNQGSPEETDDFLNTYVDVYLAESLRSVLLRQYIVVDCSFIICQYLEKMGASEETLSGGQISLERMEQIDSREELKRYLRGLLKIAFTQKKRAVRGRHFDVIETAKNEIEENYKDSSISLNTVAAKVKMAPSYFSAVFSREVGKTFVTCLTEKRMEMARELLAGTSLHTSEIGYAVGYREPHYFSTVFRKTQGCSPKQYRNMFRDKKG